MIWIAYLTSLVATAAFGAEPEAKPVKHTIRSKDGLKIVCETRGLGNTALIFLHGWCGDREHWKHQMDVFAADYRVVVLDQAGHGESGKDRKDWTIRNLAEDVESVAKALDLQRIIIVGHSMGGTIALKVAKRMPAKVLAIVLNLTLLLLPYWVLMPVHLSESVRGRIGIALVFAFTAMGHFIKTSAMTQMLPDWVPGRVPMIYLTGIFELFTAVAILIPSLARFAGVALCLFLLLIHPFRDISAASSN